MQASKYDINRAKWCIGLKQMLVMRLQENIYFKIGRHRHKPLNENSSSGLVIYTVFLRREITQMRTPLDRASGGGEVDNE